MAAFRALLVMLTVGLAAYTAVVVANHGLPALFPTFFGDIAAMGWPGQFNADFFCFLTLGGLWIAWRHGFTAGRMALGALVYVGGAPLVMTYLLVQTVRANGDMKTVLLGEGRT